jgi:hypothetical protein
MLVMAFMITAFLAPAAWLGWQQFHRHRCATLCCERVMRYADTEGAACICRTDRGTEDVVWP